LFSNVLVHNVQELLRGWKLTEYLDFCDYKFRTRLMPWKVPIGGGFLVRLLGRTDHVQGDETVVDTSLDLPLRSIDQLAFSNQFYFAGTLTAGSMILIAVGVEILYRAAYNPFGDPLMLPFAIMVVALVVRGCAFLY
jgi:hypothetical protein